MYCLKCGKQIDDGSEFCNYCGTDQSGKTVKRDVIKHSPKAPLKDRLSDALGSFGIILWYLFSCILTVAPLIMLDFPWYVDLIIIFVFFQFQILAGVAEIVLYVWAFIVTINGVQDTIAVIFYICSAIYFITKLLPFILSMFASLSDN